MVLVEYWGFGVRHVQLLLLVICGMVGGILVRNVEAAVEMVESTMEPHNFTLYDDPFRQKVKSWSPEQKHILKNGSTVARFVAALIAGLGSTTWNLKYSLLLGFIILSVQSYLIPLVANQTAYDYLLALVIFQGFVYGMIPPITTAILARWTPYMEVGRTVTLVLSSRFIGYFLTYALSTFLRPSLSGWHTLFYIVGNMGLLWCVAWFTFGFHEPQGCFYLSEKEEEFIHSNIKNLSMDSELKQRKIPWIQILTCWPFYGSVAAQVSIKWIFEFWSQTTLPTLFFNFHHKMDFQLSLEIQYLIPSFIPIVQLLLAFVVDALCKNRYPLSFIRKTSNAIGCWGSTLACLWLCYGAGPNSDIAIYVCFLYINTLRVLGSDLVIYDITRDYSGLLHGLTDFVALIPVAFFIPITGPLLRDEIHEMKADVTQQYAGMWYAGAATTFVGNFIYIVINAEGKNLAHMRDTRPSRMSLIVPHS